MSQGRPAAKPARKRANSDTNRPKGGRPTSASVPARNSPPVQGIARSSPDTRPISVVR